MDTAKSVASNAHVGTSSTQEVRWKRRHCQGGGGSGWSGGKLAVEASQGSVGERRDRDGAQCEGSAGSLHLQMKNREGGSRGRS